jgi:large conductance mechanosensitive channel
MFDLAIGIVIGTAFQNVVKSLVDDIITPPLGLLIGGVDFVNLTASIPNFVYTNQPPVVIRYGKFIQQILYLFIVAFVIFFIIKLINKLHKIAAQKKVDIEQAVIKEISDEVKVLHQIRDLLANKISSIHLVLRILIHKHKNTFHTLDVLSCKMSIL